MLKQCCVFCCSAAKLGDHRPDVVSEEQHRFVTLHDRQHRERTDEQCNLDGLNNPGQGRAHWTLNDLDALSRVLTPPKPLDPGSMRHLDAVPN